VVNIIEPHFRDGLVKRRLSSFKSTRCTATLLMSPATELSTTGARATPPSSPLQRKLILVQQKVGAKIVTILNTLLSHFFFSPREIFQIVKGQYFGWPYKRRC
jgi:hypothetical protein